VKKILSINAFAETNELKDEDSNNSLESVEELIGENFLNSNANDADNNLLNLLLSTSPTAILVVNKEKRIVVSNPASANIFNNSSELFPQFENDNKPSLIDKKIDDFVPNFTELLTRSNKKNSKAIS